MLPGNVPKFVSEGGAVMFFLVLLFLVGASETILQQVTLNPQMVGTSTNGTIIVQNVGKNTPTYHGRR